MKPYWTSHDGRHTLYHGDCLEVLPLLPPGSVDAVVTDPPYGIGDKMQGGTWGAKQKYADFREWDKAPDARALAALLQVSPVAILWGGNYFALPPSRGWLVWDKTNAVATMADCELAWTSIDQPVKRLALPVGVHTHGHPTQKPVALMQWCLGFLPAGCTVLDPFTGSGTTGVACIRTGRRFIGVEMEERYCEIAVRRMEAELAQPMLIAPEAPTETQGELL